YGRGKHGSTPSVCGGPGSGRIGSGGWTRPGSDRLTLSSPQTPRTSCSWCRVRLRRSLLDMGGHEGGVVLVQLAPAPLDLGHQVVGDPCRGVGIESQIPLDFVDEGACGHEFLAGGRCFHGSPPWCAGTEKG